MKPFAQEEDIAHIDFSRLSQHQVADMLAISARTVRRWTLDGMPRRRDGTYVSANVVAWLLTREYRWHSDRRYLARDLEDSD